MLHLSKVPTLLDVAIKAEVSTATVSRCLNNPNQVSKITYKKVKAVIDELGYAPNFSARTLATKKTNTFGAIIPTMDNAIFARGIQAFQQQLATNNITLLIASSSYKEDLERIQIQNLVARGVDALLLIGYERQAEVYDFLKKQQIPVLIAWSYEQSQNQISVGFNNYQAMRGLAQQVLRLNHRHLGMISAYRKGNDRARARILGVQSIMKKAGLNPDDLCLIETSYSIKNGENALKELLQQNPKITAVMCGNDVLAVGAMKMAKKIGLKVPQDISITGFDDIELASIAEPTLTTVRVPHKQMGKKAAQMLIDMVHQPQQLHQSLELSTRIYLRQSLGSNLKA